MDYGTVVDAAIACADLGWKSPKAALQIVESFGEAGQALRQMEGPEGDEETSFVRQEMARRLEHIEGPIRDEIWRAKVRKAADRARELIGHHEAISDDDIPD